MTLPAQQMHVLLGMMLCGAMLGAAYDAMSIMRWTLLRGKLACGVLDLFFGALSAMAMSAAALRMHTEVLRWYTCLGALLGMGGYMATAGVGVRRLGRTLRRLEKKRSTKREKTEKNCRKFQCQEEL